jgi:hypothetical protein
MGPSRSDAGLSFENGYMADAALALQSSLIGSIYDCALDPDLWPATLRRLCEVFGRNVPILVLGGRGYIASEVLRLCQDRRVRSIDVAELEEFHRFVDECRGQPAVAVNLTKSGALLEYAQQLWPGVIVLNEVYPEPSYAEIVELEGRGSSCHHIVGVEGRAWPPFPRAYRGGIPCCASLPFSPDDPIPVLVARLSPEGRLTRRS